MRRLTVEQNRVVTHALDRHALVSAVPGSGKSTVLLERVCFLIDHGVAPTSILVLMFNRSAQEHFARRLQETRSDADVHVMTFHAKGLEVCRALMADGLLPPRELVTDRARLQAFALEALNLAGAAHGRMFKRHDAEAIETLLRASEAEARPPSISLPGSLLSQALKQFAQLRATQQLMTFSDLISLPVTAARASGPVRQMMFGNFQHILVDEFQDVSQPQLELLQLLAQPDARVMVVGDEDQAIYNWRGARPEYMSHCFESLFSDCDRYTLSRTFRFGQELAVAASMLIDHNSERQPKHCFAVPGASSRLRVRATADPASTAIERACEWRSSGNTLSDCAVLVREFSLCPPVEIAALSKGLPVAVEGTSHFMQQPPFQRLWAWLRRDLVPMPESPLLRHTWMSSLMLGTGIDADARDSLLAEVQNDPDRAYNQLITLCRRVQRESKKPLWKQRSASRALACAAALASKTTLEVRAREILVATGLWLTASQRNDQRALASMRAFIKACDGMQKQAALWLQQLDERALADDEESTDERLIITSMHRSKGREWKLVMLYGLEDENFPRQDSDIEDERRLFYVAATRAREELMLLCPRDEYLRTFSERCCMDSPEPSRIHASRFVYEMHPCAAIQVAAGVSREHVTGAAQNPQLNDWLWRYQDKEFCHD